MKTEFLKSFGLEQETIDKIMAENGKDVEKQKELTSAAESERDGLKKQLDAAAEEIKSYKDLDIEGIKKAATDWESKYNTETQELKDRLAEQSYGFAVQQAVGGIKFTSESAKKAFIADLTAKKLTLQEGKLLGLEDFRKDYEASDPGAFASEDSPPPYAAGTGTNTMLTPPADEFQKRMDKYRR